MNGFFWNKLALTEAGSIGNIPSMVSVPLDNRTGFHLQYRDD